MTYQCVACGKELNVNKLGVTKEGQMLGTQGAYACNACCELVGIPLGAKGFLVAGTCSKVNFMKKYVKVRPEDVALLDCAKEEAKQKLDNMKQELKKDIKDVGAIVKKEFKNIEMKNELERKKKKLKEKVEEKFICSVCGEIWYVNGLDLAQSIYNATNSRLTVGMAKNLSKCPKCGSNANTHSTVKYWVDKKGNCVYREE